MLKVLVGILFFASAIGFFVLSIDVLGIIMLVVSMIGLMLTLYERYKNFIGGA